MRRQILPRLATINPKVVDALARTAQITAADVDRLAELDRALLKRLALGGSTAEEMPERVVLNYAALRALVLSEQRGVLRAAIARLPGGLHGIDSASVNRLLEDLSADSISSGEPVTSGPHPLIDDLAWSFVSSHKEEPSRLIIHLAQALPVQPWGPLLDATRPPTDLPNCGELQFDGWRLSVQRIARSDLPADRREMSSWQAYLDADQVGHPVLARPAEGMRVAPLGMDGKTKSLGDLFTDAKIHPSLRENWPLLIDTSGERILWVCGLRSGHSARITDNTQHVLALRWKRQELI